LVLDPEIKDASPTMPEGLRPSSSPGFEIMNDLDSGNISDGMTVEAATDLHLELELDDSLNGSLQGWEECKGCSI
jgi:hypothetical protein